MPGVKVTEVDLTKRGGGQPKRGPGVTTKEDDKTGGQKQKQGAPGVKVTEEDLTKK